MASSLPQSYRSRMKFDEQDLAPLVDHPVKNMVAGRGPVDLLDKLCLAIKKARPNFRVRFEYLVVVLMVDQAKLETGGRLSLTEGVTPFVVQGRLESISPFCKHYMYHLDPENLVTDNPKSKNWEHAQPRLPRIMEGPVNHALFDKDLDTIKATMYYDKCFRTKRDLDPVCRDMEQEDMCQKRDNGQCVVTGESNYRIFYFIPFTWNDTVEHNDATGILKQASTDLAGINLLKSPGKICNAKELGNSHKSWNMLCVQDDLYDDLVKGHCAFKFMGYSKLSGSQVLLTLQFYWMPELPEGFNDPLDNDRFRHLNHTMISLAAEINSWHGQGCPPANGSAMGKKIKSGFQVNIPMSEEDAKKMESAVKVHWACVLFTALCGGAGKAWNLTGMDLSDGTLQPVRRVNE